jgi:hypothetical protein
MSRGQGGRRGRSLPIRLLVVIMGLAAFGLSGCGSSGSESVETTAAAAPAGSSVTVETPAVGEGVLIAEEILATFDELVAEVRALADPKPDPAVLKPQLEGLYESYAPIMADLNERYLALRETDTVQWGECNSYLGEKRGAHVAAKDDVLTEALRYYNLELGDQEVVALIAQTPVDLLDAAVDQGQ